MRKKSHARESSDKKTEGARSFFEAIKAGDLETVRRMIQSDGDLLFYGSPVREAIDYYPEIADFLARMELKRLEEGSFSREHLYGAMHYLVEYANSKTGNRRCDSSREEGEHEVEAFLSASRHEVRDTVMR